jgi:hypothetical protein
VASDSLRVVVPTWAETTRSDDLAIIVTHDCDLLSVDFDGEPYAELVIARHIEPDARDGNCFRGKNPRRLQFEAGGRVYEVRSKEKTAVARELLSEHFPDETRRLPDDVRGLLPEWIAKRYLRSALPDAFNERTRRAREKIRKCLTKDGDLVSAIFLTLEPEDELPDGDAYVVLVSVLAESEDVDDTVTGARLQTLTGLIEGAITEAPGVDVRDCRLVRGDDFSFADAKRSMEWDVWDDLSYRSDRRSGRSLDHQND